MSDKVVAFDAVVRVRQFYSAYLDSIYYVEYYRMMNSKVADYARHLDFLIALGAALGGGAGLGILASPWMALPCGIITGASLVVSAAKQSYNWPEKSKFCSDMMTRYSAIAAQARRLCEDLQAARSWSPEFEAAFQAIRKQLDEIPVDQYPEMDVTLRRKIQADIVTREAPQAWWKPAPTIGVAPASPAA
ncbi:hypothetical protein ACQW02_07550 [Humitalea sp. 24SJ18S-53]|uniref:hypothetical protein n=1 Tax=Humitalea sp. 24SJ18S-53 TaxID=3422307 RepID=UPI003D66A6CC